ncbi:transposase [Azospirillum sp. CT11-132]|uniref:transposase n=1 Tax=Azospirillum sp. CT11-132 TaxID=3396317 RepID=UPI000D646DA8
MVNWYALRWLVETVMSVAKRRWGEALSARTDLTQRSQALLRGVVYNVNRLVLLGISA